MTTKASCDGCGKIVELGQEKHVRVEIDNGMTVTSMLGEASLGRQNWIRHADLCDDCEETLKNFLVPQGSHAGDRKSRDALKDRSKERAA